MPFYILLLNLTEQGIKNIRESPKRADAIEAAVEKAGGKLIGNYYTLGQYDGVMIIELPNDEALVSFTLSVGSQGNIRTTTLKAFTKEESVKIIEKLP